MICKTTRPHKACVPIAFPHCTISVLINSYWIRCRVRQSGDHKLTCLCFKPEGPEVVATLAKTSLSSSNRGRFLSACSCAHIHQDSSVKYRLQSAADLRNTCALSLHSSTPQSNQVGWDGSTPYLGPKTATYRGHTPISLLCG